MTQTISAAAQSQPAPPAQPARPGRRPLPRGIGVGLILLGVFLLGFVGYLYGLSAIQEARAQSNSFTTLRNELAQQIAPLGPVKPGTAVAILNIPAIGIKDMVVVEGTSPENLQLGPGHVRDTPLPGQTGVSELIGRRATFGGPFASLTKLRRGAKLTVITGQGTAHYTIVARGDSGHLVEDPAPNRLLLFTSCSAFIPTSYCYLDADLTSAPQPDPGGRPAINSSEAPLSGDSGALVLTMIWGIALVIVSAAGTLAASRWSPWLAYLAAAPAALAVLWNLYQSLAALLPNVY